eukprot:g3965.t1
MKTHIPSSYSAPSPRASRGKSGFAIIATLSLMILLLILAIGMLSISSVELRGSRSHDDMMIARSNARMALQIALGELQKAAGPDQRITAASSVLGDSPGNAPADGSRHWTGVWDTSAYNPKDPDTKPFLKWLVSSSETNAENIGYANSATDATHTIFQGDSDATSVKVAKVDVTDPTGNPGSYAYWVEDEGIKADLGWNEGTFTDDERKQAARLGSAPGPDYEVFGGPFDGKVDHPISMDDSATLLTNLSKSISTSDVPLAVDAAGGEKDWLVENRHHITVGTLGVLADNKLGGLRRDLSLAFEMDDDAEAENATLFNQQDGEFVAGSDRLASPFSTSGLPAKERFLWRDLSSGGTVFSSDINVSDAVLRGPSWWALRDYANLYKRLSGSPGSYTMAARNYYPNSTSGDKDYDEIFPIIDAPQTWDQEKADNFGTISYVHRPAKTNYAPVNLGSTTLVSMKAVDSSTAGNADLVVALDPFFFFWNPYNRNITFQQLDVELDVAYPGRVVFDVTVGGVKKSYDRTLMALLNKNVSGTNSITFQIQGPITMKPGEVIIATATSTPGEALIGYATDNDSGIIMRKLDGNKAISVPTTGSSVAFSFLQSGSSSQEGRHRMDTFIVPTAGAARVQTQSLYQQTWNGNRGMNEYTSPSSGSNSTVKVRTQTIPELKVGKAFFGAHSLMIRPASPGGQNANPVEIFARLNPAPMLMKRDIYRVSLLPQIFKHVTAASDFEVRNELGIDLAGDPRNAYYGLSYQQTGTKFFPMSDIPSAPLVSMAAFSNANLAIMGTEPIHAVGNSWSSALFSPTTVFGKVPNQLGNNMMAQDFSWLINDALFDRYFLSGLAPDYSITSGGYSKNGTLADTLGKFFSGDPSSAYASPVLEPYLPVGKSTDDIIDELVEEDGYKKIGAYGMIRGPFNVNSTSIPAWEAFLRSNIGLDVDYADTSGSSTGSDSIPFPGGPSPTAPGTGGTSPTPQWSGLPRLTKDQVNTLATNIVEQVKLRGPFMSVSDFVNHKLGDLDPDTSYTGALQAAIDLAADSGSGINAASRAAAANAAAVDPAAASGTPTYNATYYDSTIPVRKTTTGIPGDLTQAKLLLPLAPRLAARSDTFRIRAYGETLSKDGTTVLATATCEAVVQRIPSYVDDITDAENNQPWDEAANPFDSASATSALNPNNREFGRRFTVEAAPGKPSFRFSCVSFAPLGITDLHYREGKNYLPLTVAKGTRSTPVPLRGMEALEIHVPFTGEDGTPGYKLVGKAPLPKGTNLALFFVHEKPAPGGLPLTLSGIDDSLETFPPGTFRFANLTNVPLRVRFGGTNSAIRAGDMTVVESKVGPGGGFLPLWVIDDKGNKVYENRLWSQVSGRDMFFIGPPPRPGAMVSVMLLPQIIPPPEATR